MTSQKMPIPSIQESEIKSSVISGKNIPIEKTEKKLPIPTFSEPEIKSLIKEVPISIIKELEQPIVKEEKQIEPPFSGESEKFTETIYDIKKPNCPGTENIKFEYLFKENGEPDFNKLFSEDHIQIEITDSSFKIPDSEQMEVLRKKLDNMEPINNKDLKLVINANIALNNL